MNTLKNTAKKYTDSNVRHYNCAEVILYAANDYYGLEANSLVLKMIEPFGSGMELKKSMRSFNRRCSSYRSYVCQDESMTKKQMKYITNKFVTTFEEHFGDQNCECLMEKHRDLTHGCKFLILDTANILENTLNEYNN